MERYAAIAVIAFGVTILFVGMSLIEYGKILGIEAILKKLAIQTGAAESCHACLIETAEEREALTNYSIIGGVSTALGIGSFVVKRRTHTTVDNAAR